MGGVHFHVQRWVWIEVWGEKTSHYGFYEDDGLVSRFLEWMMTEKIDWRSQRSGGGGFTGRVPLEDEKRVRDWLKEHGAVEGEPR